MKLKEVPIEYSGLGNEPLTGRTIMRDVPSEEEEQLLQKLGAYRRLAQAERYGFPCTSNEILLRAIALILLDKDHVVREEE